MSIKYADVIVGLQCGDEGKGKVAHHLAQLDDYDVVLRYNGGSNAGHTVYHNGAKIVTHQIPIGVLYGKVSIIGPGCVVNLDKLRNEANELIAAGFDVTNLLKVDYRAHVVTDAHLDEDGSETKIGTTRQGIGPTYRDKYGRTGTRVIDVLDGNVLEPFKVIDIYDVLFVNRFPRGILCEGAQGFHLDIDWGDYPYVTSSHCTVGSVSLNGIPPHKIRKIIGVLKAYETYVGNKTHFSDKDNPIFQKIQEMGHEFGATTGRPRKVNWLNLDDVIKAINVNGVTEVIINKADVLRMVGEFGVIHKSQIIRFNTYEDFEQYVNRVLYEPVHKFVTWSSSPYSI
jgi:adenylosuccinate synthase